MTKNRVFLGTYLSLLAVNLILLGVGFFEWIIYFEVTKNLVDVITSVVVGFALFLLYSFVLLLSMDKLLRRNSLKDLCFRFMLQLFVVSGVFVGQLLQRMSMIWLMGTSIIVAASGVMILEVMLRWRKSKLTMHVTVDKP